LTFNGIKGAAYPPSDAYLRQLFLPTSIEPKYLTGYYLVIFRIVFRRVRMALMEKDAQGTTLLDRLYGDRSGLPAAWLAYLEESGTSVRTTKRQLLYHDVYRAVEFIRSWRKSWYEYSTTEEKAKVRRFSATFIC
jgi:hypothetical protein